MISITRANNGMLFYAKPSSQDIVIDGDLSDWPKDVMSYSLQAFLSGNTLEGDEDLQVKLFVAYDLKKNMLYVGVRSLDDDIVQDASNQAGWDTHDTHNLYIDAIHDPKGSLAISYVVGPNYHLLANGKVESASWDPIQVEIQQNGKEMIYEWAIHLGDQLIEGRSIGFDYVVVDKDSGEEGSPSQVALGRGRHKTQSLISMSDLVFLGKDQNIGVCTGLVDFGDAAKRNYLGRVNIVSIDNPKLWTRTPLNEEGRYSVELPEGNYKVYSPLEVVYGQGDYMRIDNSSTIVGKVKSGSPMDFPLWEASTLPEPQFLSDKGLLHDFEQKDEAKIEDFMVRSMEYFDVPGASLALVKHGKIVYHKNFGYKNAYSKDPVLDQTLFQAASITKSVFAFAVNRLAERGIINLDKPLHEYLPFEELEEDDRYKLMTARHVLTHTSGLPNWGRRLIHAPGTEPGYSGEGFEYLKRVVVEVTQKPIESILEEEVMIPLGLSDIYFSGNQEIDKRLSHGHFGHLPNAVRSMNEPMVAYSMLTEAKGFAQFMIALLDRKGMKETSFTEFFRPQTPLPVFPESKELGYEEHYGLGIMSVNTPYGHAFGHGGDNGDFKCKFEAFDEGKKGFVIFTNGSNGKLLAVALRKLLIAGESGIIAMEE